MSDYSKAFDDGYEFVVQEIESYAKKNHVYMEDLISHLKGKPMRICTPHTPNLAYCDYIATIISANLLRVDDMEMLDTISKPKYDLDEHGSMISSKKTITVQDLKGTKYKITIEAE